MQTANRSVNSMQLPHSRTKTKIIALKPHNKQNTDTDTVTT